MKYMLKKLSLVLVSCTMLLCVGGCSCFSKHGKETGVNVSPKPLNPTVVNSPVQPASPAQAAKTEVQPDAKKSAPTPAADAKKSTATPTPTPTPTPK
jgi:hypothetical protein